MVIVLAWFSFRPFLSFLSFFPSCFLLSFCLSCFCSVVLSFCLCLSFLLTFLRSVPCSLLLFCLKFKSLNKDVSRILIPLEDFLRLRSYTLLPSPQTHKHLFHTPTFVITPSLCTHTVYCTVSVFVWTGAQESVPYSLLNCWVPSVCVCESDLFSWSFFFVLFTFPLFLYMCWTFVLYCA